MTEGLRLSLLAAAIALSPITSGAKVACTPPKEPHPFEPGDLGLELRQIVNDQHEQCARKIEDYLNCLGTERAWSCLGSGGNSKAA